MLEFLDDYIGRGPADINSKPWLILGKGPSFGEVHKLDLKDFNILSLNHVLRELPVDLAHVIDIEVIKDVADCLGRQARYMVMPWCPHFKMQPSEKTLEDWLSEIPQLAALEQEGRLFYYDLASAAIKKGRYEPVFARYFSSEAALELLGRIGVKQIRSLGLDGGTSYSGEFADLRGRNLFANGQLTFDQQFSRFPSIIKDHQLDYGPLNQQVPIKVYVGGTESEYLPFKVLQHSISKYASMYTEVVQIWQSDRAKDMPQPLERANRPRTKFSFQRFLIPALNNYQGRAIYLDSDMMVLKDIFKLWKLDMSDKDLLATAAAKGQQSTRFAVMLLDCGKLDWKIETIVEGLDSGKFSYEELMQDMPLARVGNHIPANWNSLDSYTKGVTSLLHFTNSSSQPWLSRDHKYEHVFMEMLFDCLESGGITLEEIKKEVDLGHVRPSLLLQTEEREDASFKLGERALRLDRDFKPPYERIPVN